MGEFSSVKPYPAPVSQNLMWIARLHYHLCTCLPCEAITRVVTYATSVSGYTYRVIPYLAKQNEAWKLNAKYTKILSRRFLTDFTGRNFILWDRNKDSSPNFTNFVKTDNPWCSFNKKHVSGNFGGYHMNFCGLCDWKCCLLELYSVLSLLEKLINFPRYYSPICIFIC